MAGKLTNFLRDNVVIFSSLSLIIGLILLFLGITGVWFQDIPRNLLSLSRDFLEWSPYLIIFGFILLGVGIYYLYSYIKNKKFLLKELETKKRSEFLKTRTELEITVKHLPSKYAKMLKEKEKELKIK